MDGDHETSERLMCWIRSEYARIEKERDAFMLESESLHSRPISWVDILRKHSRLTYNSYFGHEITWINISNCFNSKYSDHRREEEIDAFMLESESRHSPSKHSILQAEEVEKDSVSKILLPERMEESSGSEIRPDGEGIKFEENNIESSEHLRYEMLERLLIATSFGGITRVDKFLPTSTNAPIDETTVRILCKISGDNLEFYFKDVNSMSKVIGIGIQNSKVVLTSKLQILIVACRHASHIEFKYDLWRALALKREDIYEDLVVKFPQVDDNVQLKHRALSSREFGVGLEGSKESSIAVSLNKQDFAACMTGVTPLLWDVGKYFLLRRAQYQFVGQHSNQSIATTSHYRSQENPSNDGNSNGEEEDDDEDGDEDKDKKLNPPRKANDDETLNGMVTVIFEDGVGKFSCDDGQPIPRDLQRYARIVPQIKFHFVKNSKDDRKITISSRVDFELSEEAQPNVRPSDTFGWLHDELGICMSSCEDTNPASLDIEYGLAKNLDGKPLPEGKEIQMTNSTFQGSKATEFGSDLGTSLNVPIIAKVDWKLSSKATSTHQDSNVNQTTIETPKPSILPGGFTFRDRSNRRRGHLEFEIMQTRGPLCQAIPDLGILWGHNPDRTLITTSGRCSPFNAVLQGTWINLDNQEEAFYDFICKRELSKLHRVPDSSTGDFRFSQRRFPALRLLGRDLDMPSSAISTGHPHREYHDRKVNQEFSFRFAVNHKMTHLSNIPHPNRVETHEGGLKVLVPQVLTQIVAS